MPATKNPKSVLLWSERRQVGCTIPSHAPYRGSDTWIWERWKRLTPREAPEFEREVGRPPSCETCDADRRKTGGN